MKEHRMTPEQLAIYRERKTAGCYNCKHQVIDSLKWQKVCRMETAYKKKFGHPNATRDDCSKYQPKEKK